MKTRIPFVAVSLAAACSMAMATEYGTVISSTPVTAQVGVPQQQCFDQQQAVQPRTSGGGALLGAVIGGVVGSRFGGGMGRAAATGVGVVAGAAVGDHVENSNTPVETTTVRNCTNTTAYENRVVGYDVVYEYNGQRYMSRMTQDPGQRIALNVNVTPEGNTVSTAPPPTVVQTVPVAPVVYAAPQPYGYYYGGPRVTVVPSFVFGGYYGHHHHGW
jgi:uncharacterized protein YcfJ